MKGTKLFILVLLAVVIFWVGFMYMVSGGLSSWSIADNTSFRWMLGLILISISRLWWKFESEYYFRNAVLLGKWKLPTIENFKVKLVNVDIRYKDAFEFAGWAFASIAVFGLGGSVFMQIMHYIVTAAAAAVTFIIVVRSNHGLQRVLYAVGMGIGVFVWVVGFTTNIFSVYFGEFVFVIPVVVWVLNQFKLIK